MIIRKNILETVRPFISKPVVRVITGIRRCVKSVLMQQLRDELLAKGVLEKHIIYIKIELNKIDFICTKGNEKLYLQVCKSLYEGNATEREYKAYRGIDNHFPKYVLSLDNGWDTDKNGIRWMNIKDFLLSKM